MSSAIILALFPVFELVFKASLNLFSSNTPCLFSACAWMADIDIISFSSAISLALFASPALVNNPLSPVNVEMVTPC